MSNSAIRFGSARPTLGVNERECFRVGGAFGCEPVEQSWEAAFGRTVKVRRWLSDENRAEYVRLSYRDTWSREGLEALVKSAMIDFHCKSCASPLPWNLFKILDGPYTLNGRTAFYERLEGDDRVAEAARFAGWLKGAAEFPRLVNAIRHIVSGRGVNSSYTYVSLWTFAKATRSPGRADRQFAAVRTAANTHLAAYGLRVQWGEVARAVIKHPTRVNRAALKAAAATINNHVEYLVGQTFSGRYIDVLKKARGLARALKAPPAHLAWSVEHVERCEFAFLRDALPSASDRLIFDRTDGVELWLDPETVIRRHGVTTTQGWSASSNRAEIRYLVRGSGRTFHTNHSYGGATRAIEEALGAWREQRRLETTEADLVGFLRGDLGFVPIVHRNDSIRAGNCLPGTESWVRSHGWGSRQWIPGHYLIPLLGESRVRNVAVRLREEMLRD
jgi:hypothetical protein